MVSVGVCKQLEMLEHINPELAVGFQPPSNDEVLSTTHHLYVNE